MIKELPAWWLLPVLAFGLLLFYIMVKQIQQREAARQAKKNPRSYNINETIYNIDRSGTEQRNMPESEADAKQEAAVRQRNGELSTRRAFFQAQRLLPPTEE